MGSLNVFDSKRALDPLSIKMYIIYINMNVRRSTLHFHPTQSSLNIVDITLWVQHTFKIIKGWFKDWINVLHVYNEILIRGL